jgi:hypothetical protein
MSPAEEIRGTAIRLRQLPSELQRVERSAGRRAARKLRLAALDRFTATGLGRAIFRARAASADEKASRTRALRAVFPMPRVESPAEGALRISYSLKGTAALVQQGGRTKAHEIVAPRAKFLSRRGAARLEMARRGFVPPSLAGLGRVLALKSSGGTRFAVTVKHPGSRIPQNRFLDAAGADALQVLQFDLEQGYQKATGKV